MGIPCFHAHKNLSWIFIFFVYHMSLVMRKPVNPRSLISTFVVRSLESIIPVVASTKFQDSS